MRHRAAEVLAQDGSPAAAKALAGALVRSKDPQVKSIALNALQQICDQECINSVCLVWVATRQPDLAKLLSEKDWVASTPTKIKVLTALKAKQLDVIKTSDKEIVEQLLEVLKDVDPDIANRAKQCASSLTNTDAVDYLCEKWFKTRAPLLEKVVVQGGYVAKTPIQVKLLSALKVGKRQTLARDGVDIFTPLLQACKDKDSKIATEANALLGELQNESTVNSLCKEWASTRAKHLEDAIHRGCYIATSPIELRVLTALKANKPQVITNGGIEVVKLLIQAFSDTDPEIASHATQYACSLTNVDAIDYLCKRWYETYNPQLEQIVMRAGYVAHRPLHLRVASALKTDKWQKSTTHGQLGQIPAVTKGGAEVVVPLLQAYEGSDAIITERARRALGELENPDAQEELCKLAIEQDHQLAREIAVACQYAPRDPAQQSLFYCLTEQWHKYESLDFDCTLLQKVYAHSKEQLRQKIAQKIRQAGRAEWVQVIVGGRHKQRLGEITNAEWELATSLLIRGQRWEEIWRYAQTAPPVWSAELLQQLNAVKWMPEDRIEQTGFEELTCLAQYGRVKCLNTLSGHTDLVSCLAFSPNGRLLASGSQDKTVLLWDWQNDVAPKKILEQHTHWVVCLAISPDGKLLATGSRDRKVRLWQLPDGKLLRTLAGYQDWVISLAISPNSKLLATGSDDETIRLWSLPDGNLLKIIKAHASFVRCLAISPDGTLLATGSEDKTVKLWSLPDGELLKTLTGHNGMIRCLAISPNGQLLATGSYDSTVQLWSLPSGNQWKTLQGHTQEVMCLAIAPSSRWLATGSMDETVRLWSLVDGSLLKTLRRHTNVVRGLAISPDGQYLATGSGDRTVQLWMGQWLDQECLPDGELEDLTFVQVALQDEAITDEERGWLEFSKSLLRWRKRFDVELEEATGQTDFGEFDIEVEG